MSRGVERMDPYGDASEPAWTGRPAERPVASSEAGNQTGVLSAAAERHADEIARALGIDVERVREVLRRAAEE